MLRPMGRERACSLTVLSWSSFDLGEEDSSVLPEACKNLFKFTVHSSQSINRPETCERAET